MKMKSKITKLLMLAMVVVGIGMVSSCKDYDEDRYNDLNSKLKDQNATLVELINAQKQALTDQKAKLQGQIKALQDSINQNIKSCTCTPEKLKNSIAAYVLEKNITDQNKVAQMISDSIAAHPGLSKEEVQKMIDGVQATILASDQLKQLIVKNAQDVNRADSLLNIAQSADIATLKKAVEDLDKELVEQGKDVDNLNGQIENLNGQIDNLSDSIQANTDSIKVLIQITSNLNKSVLETAAKANSAYELAEQNSIKLEGLKELADSVITYIAAWGPQISKAAADASAALAKANTLETLYNETLNTINLVKDELLKNDTALSKQIEELAEKVAKEMENFASKKSVENLSDSLKSLYASMDQYAKLSVLKDYAKTSDLKDYAKTSDLKDYAKTSDLKNYVKASKFNLTIAKLEQAYQNADKALDARITALEENALLLQDSINALINALKAQVTSLLIQEVNNPVFGTFAYPTGFSTKVLALLYGVSDYDVEFPTDATLNYVHKEYALTAKDMEMINGVNIYYAYAQQTLMDETEGNAGKLYVTVNPNTTDFTGKVLDVVNSQDKQALVALSPLKYSDYLIGFGHRAASNGFYEANATIKADDVETLKLKTDVDKQDLKDVTKAVFNALKGINTSNVGSKLNEVVAPFTSAVLAYNSAIEGLFHNLDANAVKATWSDNLGTHSVVSQYEMAVTAIQPLSYSFLKDNTNLGRIPNFNRIADKLHEKINDLKITFDPIEIKIDTSKAQITFQKFHLDDLGDLAVVVKMPQFNKVTKTTGGGQTYETYEITYKNDTIKVDNLDSWLQKLEGKFNNQVADMGTKVADKLSNEVNRVIKQVNEQVADINEQVQGQLDKNLTKVRNKLNTYVDKFTSKMNSFVNGINNRLNNINGYLNISAVYQAKDKCLYSLSTTIWIPTEFVGTGGIELYLTSLTGELLVPAFKKHIAVTNVYKNGEITTTAQGGNPDCKAVLDEANKADGMNTVLDRTSTETNSSIVLFTGKPGYTYELAYSALDYQGKITTRKYYVTVK